MRLPFVCVRIHAAAWSVLALAGCGPSPSIAPPESASAQIGPQGGTVRATGITLTIPPGAVGSTTTIGITEDPSGPPSSYVALSPLFRFTPDGLTFATPATATFVTSSSAPTGSVFWSDATGGYGPLSTAWNGSTAMAQIQHFSSGFVGIARDGGASESGAGAGNDATTGQSLDASASSDADVAVTPASLGGICDPLPPEGPPLLCQSGLTCSAGVCAQTQAGTFCNSSDECKPQGCVGTLSLKCNLATSTCECTCICTAACSTCAAPIAQLGEPCYATPTLDLDAGVVSPTCILSLSCIDGTCQTPGSAGSEAGTPASDAAAEEASAPEASTADVAVTPAGLGGICDPLPPEGPPLLCQSGLACSAGVCAQTQAGTFCNSSNECKPQGCVGTLSLKCDLATSTCECTCICTAACSTCAAPIAQLGERCYATPTFDSDAGVVSPACILSLSCIDGTCQTPGSAGSEAGP